jgi:hypothetical protein
MTMPRSNTNLPGFSAEASLYTAATGFRHASAFTQSDKRIHPAQVTPWPVDVGGIGDLDTAQPRTYGTITPINEDNFSACVRNCRVNNRTATYSDCWRTCCRQYTGLSTCVIA